MGWKNISHYFIFREIKKLAFQMVDAVMCIVIADCETCEM